MTAQITIRRATTDDVREVAVMAGELLDEIMAAIGTQAFHFDLDETALRLMDFLDREKYFVFVACDTEARPIGFVAIHESHALYAEGAFGTMAEFYVRSAYRSQGIGHRLLERARSFGVSRGWKRLEVTTPPLPQFDRTLTFYEREGFAVTGGRKLKMAL